MLQHCGVARLVGPHRRRRHRLELSGIPALYQRSTSAFPVAISPPWLTWGHWLLTSPTIRGVISGRRFQTTGSAIGHTCNLLMAAKGDGPSCFTSTVQVISFSLSLK